VEKVLLSSNIKFITSNSEEQSKILFTFSFTIVNNNNKNKFILSKINTIPQLGEKNTKLIFINNFVHKKDTIEI
jgi:hypothetical protein